MNAHNFTVADCPALAEAESVITEMPTVGGDMETLSLRGRDAHPDGQAVGCCNTVAQTKAWGMYGGLGGGFLGSACYWVPGSGPMLAAGPFAGLREDAAMAGGGRISDARKTISPSTP